MPRTKSSGKSSEKIGIPEWIEDEIKSIQFTESEIINRTGYILEIYLNDYKLDIQLYEALPDGRTIVQGITKPPTQATFKLMNAAIYDSNIQMSRGKLSDKTTAF